MLFFFFFDYIEREVGGIYGKASERKRGVSYYIKTTNKAILYIIQTLFIHIFIKQYDCI